MKKNSPPEFRERYLDTWSSFVSPGELADKLDSYEDLRVNFCKEPRKKNFVGPDVMPRISPVPRESRSGNDKCLDFRPRKKKIEGTQEERPVPSCYGCGALGVIRPNCNNCSPRLNQDRPEIILNSVNLDQIDFHGNTTPKPKTLNRIFLHVNGLPAAVCADTGANYSIAGEKLYQALQKQGCTFSRSVRKLTLGNGRQQTVAALSTEVVIHLAGRLIPTRLVIFPSHKNSRTLLGTDFLENSGVVLNMKNKTWHFVDRKENIYPFYDEREKTVVKRLTNNIYPQRAVISKPGGGTPKRPHPDGQRKDIATVGKGRRGQAAPKTPAVTNYDLREVVNNDNFVAEMTPYLQRFNKSFSEVKSLVEEKQNKRNRFANRKRRNGLIYTPGDHVYVAVHAHSNKNKKWTTKFTPKRDGPYVILTKRSPVTYEIASLDNPGTLLGVYHVSALTPCPHPAGTPLIPLRKRGRPPRQAVDGRQSDDGTSRCPNPVGTPLFPRRKRGRSTQILDAGQKMNSQPTSAQHSGHPVRSSSRLRDQRGRL